MSLQLLLAATAAGLAAFYFIRGTVREFRAGASASGPACGKCNPDGCPAARPVR